MPTFGLWLGRSRRQRGLFHRSWSTRPWGSMHVSDSNIWGHLTPRNLNFEEHFPDGSSKVLHYDNKRESTFLVRHFWTDSKRSFPDKHRGFATIVIMHRNLQRVCLVLEASWWNLHLNFHKLCAIGIQILDQILGHRCSVWPRLFSSQFQAEEQHMAEESHCHAELNQSLARLEL